MWRQPAPLATRNARRIARSMMLSTSLALGISAGANAAPAPPPGFNVHLVQDAGTGRFWRGGAPRQDTLQALGASARKRGVTVTLIDLRAPSNRDDRSGKAGRLSPADEAAAGLKLGMQYLAVNALDKKLPD